MKTRWPAVTAQLTSQGLCFDPVIASGAFSRALASSKHRDGLVRWKGPWSDDGAGSA